MTYHVAVVVAYLGSDLVAALAGLDVHDFSHGYWLQAVSETVSGREEGESKSECRSRAGWPREAVEHRVAKW